jgi:hypothetical protein
MPPKTAVPSETSLRPASWWQRASTGQTIAAAIAFSALIFLLTIGFDFLATRYRPVLSFMVIVDGAVALLCGALLWRIVQDARVRHRMLIERLAMVGELNHHIRNALESIQLTAHSSQNQELIEQIQNAVSRIQWALREVLPEESDMKP